MKRAGITLIELLIVMAIIAAIAAVSFPSLTAGLAGVRLVSAAGTTASFLAASMNQVERHEEPAAITISPESGLEVFTAHAHKELVLPKGITIEGDQPRRFELYPGGAFPRIRLIIRNENGNRRSIEIDPVTAVPNITKLIEEKP